MPPQKRKEPTNDSTDDANAFSRNAHQQGEVEENLSNIVNADEQSSARSNRLHLEVPPMNTARNSGPRFAQATRASLSRAEGRQAASALRPGHGVALPSPRATMAPRTRVFPTASSIFTPRSPATSRPAATRIGGPGSRQRQPGSLPPSLNLPPDELERTLQAALAEDHPTPEDSSHRSRTQPGIHPEIAFSNRPLPTTRISRPETALPEASVLPASRVYASTAAGARQFGYPSPYNVAFSSSALPPSVDQLATFGSAPANVTPVLSQPRESGTTVPIQTTTESTQQAESRQWLVRALPPRENRPGLGFRTLVEARESRDRLQAPRQFDVPLTDPERVDYVRRLTYAIVDTNTVRDREYSDAARRFGLNGIYTFQDANAIAHVLVSIAVDLHSIGIRSAYIAHGRDWPLEEHVLTFQQRIKWAELCLRQFKHIADWVMRESFMEELMFSPQRMHIWAVANYSAWRQQHPEHQQDAAAANMPGPSSASVVSPELPVQDPIAAPATTQSQPAGATANAGDQGQQEEISFPDMVEYVTELPSSEMPRFSSPSTGPSAQQSGVPQATTAEQGPALEAEQDDRAASDEPAAPTQTSEESDNFSFLDESDAEADEQ